MEKKKLLIGAGLIFIFALAIFIANPGISTAQDCRIIRLHGLAVPKVKIEIEPATLTISKGGCVVWINWVRAEEVVVEFAEGKKCLDMTDAPSGFKMDSTTDCYVSTFVRIGETTSLRFTEEGTFEYEVRVGKTTKKKGKIIVE